MKRLYWEGLADRYYLWEDRIELGRGKTIGKGMSLERTEYSNVIYLVSD